MPVSADWRTLPAGRELDALVAERVLGWHRVPQPKDYDGNYGGEPVLVPPGMQTIEQHTGSSYALPPRGCLHLAYFTPQVSTDLIAAWRLACRLVSRTETDPLRIAFVREIGGPSLFEYPPSQAALVICRAALAAVEVDRGH
jgi:hypothetical protein